MPGFTAFSKAGLFVAALGLSMLGLRAQPASAHEIQTICDEDGDRCFRAICDDDGDDCRPLHRHYHARAEWVCNPWGGDCRPAYPAYYEAPPPPPVYRYRAPEPALFFGFHIGH